MWYEWYAEAFLPLPDASLVQADAPTPTSAQGEDSGTLQGAAEKTPSPLIDAMDVAAGSDHQAFEPDASAGKLRVDTSRDASESGNGIRLVKVGQTTLHNPRGRSSWIGL